MVRVKAARAARFASGIGVPARIASVTSGASFDFASAGMEWAETQYSQPFSRLMA
jgi:hypothetical protein